VRDPHVSAVLSQYGLGTANVQQIEPLDNAGGFSGSRLWRIRVAADALDGATIQAWLPEPIRLPGFGFPSLEPGLRQLCLRRWPASHPTIQTLGFIHPILRQIASSLPAVACPFKTITGRTWVDYDGCLWELCQWRPGSADYYANPIRARLQAAMRTLARFHDLAAIHESARGLPRAFTDRWQHAEKLHGSGLASIEAGAARPLGNEIDVRSTRLLSLARLRIPPPWQGPAVESVSDLPLLPAIRDIHHDHVLFTGDEVTGIIDFGAMRIDTPLTDVARLVGSLAGDDREARRVAFDAYSELRPLSGADRRLINWLDRSGVVLGAMNWLWWLYVERRDMGPVEPIIKRLDHLLQRLELASEPWE
jgi:hypothetical protein